MASFHTHSSFAAQFSTAVLCFHRHSRVGRSFLELLSSFSVSPKRHLVSAWPAKGPANSGSPHMDYAVSGAQKGPDQIPVPCSLFPVPFSLFPTLCPCPSASRILNPES